MSMRRRQFLKTAAAGAATVPLLRTRARAQAKPIRIGYTMSATGPYAVGAGITQAPNYTLWQDQVNAQGGLAVKGEGRRPIEFVTIDDRSEIETAVRFYEKLATDDKVDLLLPPWGSAMNFAIGAGGRQVRLPDDRSHRHLREVQGAGAALLLHDAGAARAADAGGGRLAARTCATRARSRRSRWPTSTICSASS